MRIRTLSEIYNSARIQQIREQMVQGRYADIAPCRECSYRIDWWDPVHSQETTR
jgi:hypothetical protein